MTDNALRVVYRLAMVLMIFSFTLMDRMAGNGLSPYWFFTPLLLFTPVSRSKTSQSAKGTFENFNREYPESKRDDGAKR